MISQPFAEALYKATLDLAVGYPTSLHDYLVSKSDFWVAPASHKYHHAYKHGLLQHCCEVFENLLKLESIFVTGISPAEMYILAFGHDVTKINYYRLGTRNVKVNGNWKAVPDYKYEEDTLALGHASGSTYIVNQIVPLTERLTRAILFHMGPFGGFQCERDYSNACDHDMLVLMMHTADMMSSKGNYPVMRKINAERE